jgi:acyl-CoA reductase-like NAD-dependent aldehyde dehydrogenase
MNSGQTCIGVDHVFVHESKCKIFEQKLLIKIEEAYGNNLEKVAKEGNYGKIINTYHFQRLVKYLDEANHKGRVLL